MIIIFIFINHVYLNCFYWPLVIYFGCQKLFLGYALNTKGYKFYCLSHKPKIVGASNAKIFNDLELSGSVMQRLSLRRLGVKIKSHFQGSKFELGCFSWNDIVSVSCQHFNA